MPNSHDRLAAAGVVIPPSRGRRVHAGGAASEDYAACAHDPFEELAGRGLVERHVVDHYPPQTQYRLTKRAELILPHLRRI